SRWMVASCTGKSSGVMDALCEVPLLSAAEERELFHAMNCMKFTAARQRERLEIASPDEDLMDGIESLLDHALALRDHVLSANGRLAASIVKNFLHEGVGFDELFSDGMQILFGCVEKFDYSRNFRFSTYATHSIRRALYRQMCRRKKDAAHLTTSMMEEQPERSRPGISDGECHRLRGIIEELLDYLRDRERDVIRDRFGLGSEEAQTLQVIAKKMGVCKERVRQIEQRAIRKLRDLAAEMYEPANFETS
ncbi:MAG: sigma-70 family RNA polymerase sigma factor, partial [Planctomycetales bacterium]